MLLEEVVKKHYLYQPEKLTRVVIREIESKVDGITMVNVSE